jgi:hypothetical protein
MGLTEDWSEVPKSGNPAASPLIKLYLKRVKEEQASCGVLPKQAIPMFADKLAQLADHIENKLRPPNQSPISLYVLARACEEIVDTHAYKIRRPFKSLTNMADEIYRA